MFRRRTWAWAIFLGCSWTWCIGMFLPVLLVRDYGVWGWVVFAVPNVIGAAAMGWVLRTKQASEWITQEHLYACVAFSVVTISFQLYFLLAYLEHWRVAGWVLALLIGMGWTGLRLRELKWAACGAWVVSLSAFAWFLARFGAGGVEVGARAATELAPLWIACVVGFALCPYLDLTFHQARQALPARQAKVAFAAGFGVVFLTMIVFTLCYASAILKAGGIVAGVLAVHMGLQILFTVAAHLRAAAAFEGDHKLCRMALTAAVVVALALGLAAQLGQRERILYHGTELREVFYLVYMGAYGLVFPAYVWICMAAGRRPDRRMVRTLLGVVLVASPMFWMGFIERRMFWLLPGLTIILVARLAVRRGGTPGEVEAGAMAGYNRPPT